jgi:hypothetical protein
VTNRPQEAQEYAAHSLWRKRCCEHATKDCADEGVEPIFLTEATGSVNEIVELRVQGSRLLCRERVCAPGVLREFFEPRRNFPLLAPGEGRILANVIESRVEKRLSASLKLSPHIRHFEIALNVLKPTAKASNERLPAIFVDRPIYTVPDYAAPDVVRRIGDDGETRHGQLVFHSDFRVVVFQIKLVRIESDLLDGLKDSVCLPLPQSRRHRSFPG